MRKALENHVTIHEKEAIMAMIIGTYDSIALTLDIDVCLYRGLHHFNS